MQADWNEDVQKLYSGFYRSNGKVVVGDMDEIPPMSWDEAVDSGEDFVGRLKESVVMIDLDDAAEALAMMRIVEKKDLQCVVVQTTRGKHFYFLNDWIKVKHQIELAKSCRLFIGFHADIRLGTKHGYSPIRVDGEFRKVEKCVAIIKPVPYYFMPDHRGNKKYDFFGMGANDGRNETLFRYIGHLQNRGLSKTQIIKMYSLINEYVLGDPLDRNEFETLLREEAFFESLQSDFFDGKSFKHAEFGDFLQKTYKIVRLDGSPQLYINDRYTDDPTVFHGVMIHHIKTLKESQRNEVMQYLKKSPSIASVNEADPRYILLMNGVYDIHLNKIVPWQEGMIFKNQLNVMFDPEAKADIVDKFINDFTCGDDEVEKLIYEAVGYTMYRRCPLKTIFFLYGPRADNGKSTFLDMLQNLLGEDNTCNVALQNMENRFDIIELYGKLANIVDDVALSRIKSTSILKSASDGRRIKGERKGENSISFRPYATFFTGGNTVPKADDKTNGWTNRLCIIPCNAHFPKGDPRRDPDMGIKLSTDASKSYLFNRAMDGLRRALKKKGFTKPEIVRNEIEAYHLGNNSVLRYFKYRKDLYISEHSNLIDEPEGDEWLFETTPRMFKRAYDVWCEEEGIHSKANARQISEELQGLGYVVGERKRVNKVLGRYFTKL